MDLEKVWVMFSSIVLAFAFMFGNSVKTVYESIIYLFVVHPFDVGDKIIVDTVSSKVSCHNRPHPSVLCHTCFSHIHTHWPRITNILCNINHVTQGLFDMQCSGVNAAAVCCNPQLAIAEHLIPYEL